MILSHDDTKKLYDTLSKILPSFYAFIAAVKNSPEAFLAKAQFRNPININIPMAGIKTADSRSTSLNSSMSTNLMGNSERKEPADTLEDEADLSNNTHIDYYDAAALFHTIPELKDIAKNLISSLQVFESGGLCLLNIFIDSGIQMNYKLLQAFILNFFIWGSHRISPYFEGKAQISYTNNIALATVVPNNNEERLTGTISWLSEIESSLKASSNSSIPSRIRHQAKHVYLYDP